MATQKLQVATVTPVTPGTVTDRIAMPGSAADNKNNGCVLYVGGTGDVQLITASGDNVTFTAVPAGTFLPVQTLQVVSTGTTATNILACW